MQPQTCEKFSFCCLSQRLWCFVVGPADSDRERGAAQGALRPPCLSLHGCPCLDPFVCLSSRLPLSRSPSLCSFARVAVKKDHKSGDLKQEKPFTGLEASSLKSRCQQGRALPESSGRASFLPLPASSGSLAVAASLQPLPPSPRGFLPYVSASQVSLSFLSQRCPVIGSPRMISS